VNAQVTASYEQGIKAAKANQWQKAREAFLRAWELKRHYQIAANLGRAELKLRMYRDAAEHLDYFLREAKDISAEDRDQARKLFDEARAKIAVITVDVNVAGAEVLIDGNALGPAPLAGPILVEPGRRTIYARSQGYKSRSLPVDAVAAGSHHVVLELAEEEPPPKPQPVVVEAASKPVETAGPNKALAFAGVAASAGAIGGGVTLAVASRISAGPANQIDQDLGEEPCPLDPPPMSECSHLKSARAAQNTLANGAFWSLIAGGTLAAATLAYVVVASKEPEKSGGGVRVLPAVAATGGGMVIAGTW
jgi:hypothetical protein